MTYVRGDIDENLTIVGHVSTQVLRVQSHCLWVLCPVLASLGLACVPERWALSVSAPCRTTLERESLIFLSFSAWNWWTSQHCRADLSWKQETPLHSLFYTLEEVLTRTDLEILTHKVHYLFPTRVLKEQKDGC